MTALYIEQILHVWNTVNSTLTGDTDFREVSFYSAGFYSGPIHEELINAIETLNSPFGPVTMIFNGIGDVHSIVISLSEEAFDPRTIERVTVIPSISYERLRDFVLQHSMDPDDPTVMIYFRPLTDWQRPRIIDSRTLSSPYGLVTLDYIAEDTIDSFEVV
ncbi:MAG: hypothetical protein ACRDJE_00870 [Dehalococcoidia bacterium]